MRTTLNLNEQLMEQASRLCSIHEKTALIHTALQALIAQAAAKRLAELGGSAPRAKKIPRRRSTAK